MSRVCEVLAVVAGAAVALAVQLEKVADAVQGVRHG